MLREVDAGRERDSRGTRHGARCTRAATSVDSAPATLPIAVVSLGRARVAPARARHLLRAARDGDRRARARHDGAPAPPRARRAALARFHAAPDPGRDRVAGDADRGGRRDRRRAARHRRRAGSCGAGSPTTSRSSTCRPSRCVAVLLVVPAAVVARQPARRACRPGRRPASARPRRCARSERRSRAAPKISP